MHGRRTDPTKLRALIVARRLTIKAFYERAGISKSTAFAVLAGKRDFSDITAAQVAEALGCGVEDFSVADESPVAPDRDLALDRAAEEAARMILENWGDHTTDLPDPQPGPRIIIL